MLELPVDFSPLDPGRIDSTDPFEIEYWSRELGCSTEVLRDLVSRLGEHVNVVREALATNPSAKP